MFKKILDEREKASKPPRVRAVHTHLSLCIFPPAQTHTHTLSLLPDSPIVFVSLSRAPPHSQLPLKIIYFRDGLSDRQFDIAKEEVSAIKAEYSSRGAPK